MNLKTSRFNRAIIFWSVCIPVRLYITMRAAKSNLRVHAAAVAFMWLSGRHSDELEGAFGGHAWWAGQRHAHGMLWAAYAATGRWEFLAMDTAGGAWNWLTSSQGLV